MKIKYKTEEIEEGVECICANCGMSFNSGDVVFYIKEEEPCCSIDCLKQLLTVQGKKDFNLIPETEYFKREA